MENTTTTLQKWLTWTRPTKGLNNQISKIMQKTKIIVLQKQAFNTINESQRASIIYPTRASPNSRLCNKHGESVQQITSRTNSWRVRYTQKNTFIKKVKYIRTSAKNINKKHRKGGGKYRTVYGKYQSKTYCLHVDR